MSLKSYGSDIVEYIEKHNININKEYRVHIWFECDMVGEQTCNLIYSHDYHTTKKYEFEVEYKCVSMPKKTWAYTHIKL